MITHDKIESTICDVTVVIPCRNEGKYILKTIQRLKAQKGVGTSFSWEVLFLDGCSDDDTVQILQDHTKKLDDFYLHINKKQITPSAFNLGIEKARGRFICILGAHAEIESDYILNCFEVIQRTGADNVGGPWIAKGSGYVGTAIAHAFQSPIAVGGAASHNSTYEGQLDSVWGGFYKKSVFEKIGNFDEELVRNQDDELNFRLTQSGGIIWQSPSIRYTYASRNKLRKLWQQYFQYGYWKVRVIQKHKQLASIRHLVPSIFVAAVMFLFLVSPFFQFAQYILAITLAAYLTVILLGSVAIAMKKQSWRSLPILPIIFTIFHVSYGFGFLFGIFNFLIFKNKKKQNSLGHRLSR